MSSGTVDGTIEGDVAGWRGIPYAAAPTGPNRWRAPQPVTWTGVRKADAYGHDCLQAPAPPGPETIRTTPSEDCLFLNVWRPATALQRLPVLVWIHGGAFVAGGSSAALYAGDTFARDGLVFVSFNYRLGRFGFFAHPALSGPQGNYAYMDQIAALRWVRANIAKFGGDPANVTVFGESAGGAMTLGLLGSPAAKGLFARVAVSSGGTRDGFRMPPTLAQAEQTGANFARQQGAATAAALRALPADIVLGDLRMATLDTASTGPEATFTRGPITDGTIVTGTIGAMLDARTANPLPLLIGTNSADGCCATGTTPAAWFARFGPRAAAAQVAYQDHDDGHGPSIANAVERDFAMTEPARDLAGAATTGYLYRFTYVPASKLGTWHGAPHGSDLPFFFDKTALKFGAGETATDRAMARTMHRTLVDYARNGHPGWAPARAGDGKVMLFGADGQARYGDDPWKPLLDLVQASR